MENELQQSPDFVVVHMKINKELESELDTYVDGKFKPHEIDKIVDFIKKGL